MRAGEASDLPACVHRGNGLRILMIPSNQGLPMRNSFAFLVLTLLITSHIAVAGNWPHWRGDSGNGVSLTAAPPVEFSDTKNVKWKVGIPGEGSGSPVVWEDNVFVVSAVPTDGRAPVSGGRRAPKIAGRLAFNVYCFDRNTGDLKWEQTATEATPHQGTHQTNGFASASPCTDGEHLYAHFGSRGIFAYTLDGELVWKRTDLGKMETRNAFGEGSSPTLAGNRLLVPWYHEGASSLICLDKTTGDSLWRASVDEPTNWATPLVLDHNGREQIIISGQNAVRAHDLETGEEIWRHANSTQRPVASPVSANGVVYVGHGFRGNFMGAYTLSGEGDIAGSSHVLWTKTRNTPDIASFLLSENRLYFFKEKTGILSCVDAKTGEPFYETKRVPGASYLYASPIAAGGHVYITDRSGAITVIKDSERLEVVAENQMGQTVDATPAPVDNQLFIRGQQDLFCIEG